MCKIYEIKFILFPVFKDWLAETGLLEDVKPKPKPVIGTPRGRSMSPKRRYAVRCRFQFESKLNGYWLPIFLKQKLTLMEKALTKEN